MRRDREDFPSSSRHNNKNGSARRNDGTAQLNICSLDKNWDSRIDAQDITEFLPRDMPLLEVYLGAEFAQIRFQNLPDCAAALKYLQGVQLKRFPDIFLKTRINTHTKLNFNLCEVVVKFLPADARASEVERFVRETDPKARFVRALLPYSVTLCDRVKTRPCVTGFVTFGSIEDAQDAVRVLQNRQFDPRYPADPTRNPLIKLEISQEDEPRTHSSHSSSSTSSRYDEAEDDGYRNSTTRGEEAAPTKAAAVATSTRNYNNNNNYQDERREHRDRDRDYNNNNDNRSRHHEHEQHHHHHHQHHHSDQQQQQQQRDHHHQRNDEIHVIIGFLKRDLLPRQPTEKIELAMKEEIAAILKKQGDIYPDKLSANGATVYARCHSFDEGLRVVDAMRFQPSNICNSVYSADLTTKTHQSFGLKSVRTCSWPVEYDSISKIRQTVRDVAPDGFIAELLHIQEPQISWLKHKEQDPRGRAAFLVYRSDDQARRAAVLLDNYQFRETRDILQAHVGRNR